MFDWGPLIPFLIIVVILLISGIKNLKGYERGVIFRLGKIMDTRGPGVIYVIPLIERMIRVNLNKQGPDWQGLPVDDLNRRVQELVSKTPHEDIPQSPGKKRALLKKVVGGLGLIVFLVLISAAIPGPLYRVNLRDVGLDANGYAYLKNVPVEKGETYTIFLVDLRSFHFPGTSNSSRISNETGMVEIYDKNFKKIPNRIEWFTSYGTASEWGYKQGVFIAPKQGFLTLVLWFEPSHPIIYSTISLERNRLNNYDYEIVIRKSKLSGSFLIILSDLGTYFSRAFKKLFSTV